MDGLYSGLWTGFVFFCGGLFGLWLRMRQEKEVQARAHSQYLQDRLRVMQALSRYYACKDTSEGTTNAHQRV
jgi:hypothetical protein